MALNLIYNDTEATCALCSHEGSGESTHFAKICVATGSKKRSRARRRADDSEHGGCYINISVWDTASILSSRSVAKSLSLTYAYEQHLGSWKRARILAVKEVLEVSTLIHTTFAVLAVYGRKKFGTILCKITERSTEVLPAVNHDEEPLSVVIIRGPSLLLLSVCGVKFFSCNGSTSVIYSCGNDQNAVERWTVRPVADDDSKAIVCTQPDRIDSSSVIEVSAVHWNGAVVTSFNVSSSFASPLSLLAASMQQGVLLFSTSEGYLYAFDYNGQGGTWQTQKPSAIIKDVRHATVYKEFLVLTTLDESEDVFLVDLRNRSNHSQNEVQRLFSPTCEQKSEAEHKHLHACWKEVFLKVSNNNGSCCVDKEIERQVEYESSRCSSRNPSLLQIEENLEGRLQRGLDRFLEHAERITDKRQLLNRILVLLTEEIGSSTSKPFAPMFKHSLQRVASVRNRREGDVRSEANIAESRAFEYQNLEAPERRRNLKSSGILKLVDNKCGLDCTGNCLMIQTEIAFHESEYDRDVNAAEGFSMKLNFSCSDRIPTVWSFNEVSFTENHQSYSLYGFAPLGVFAHSSKLSTLTCSARVNLSNGCSQLVGLFTIASILSSNHHSKTTKKAISSTESVFNSVFHIIARGLTPGQLAELEKDEDITQNASIAMAENLPRFTLNSKSQNDLATTIARLAIRAGDKVKFCSSPEPSRCALYDVDTAANLLQDEKKLIRVIGSQKNAYGYTPEDIDDILQKQVDVDEAFGLIEEQQLWF